MAEIEYVSRFIHRSEGEGGTSTPFENSVYPFASMKRPGAEKLQIFLFEDTKIIADGVGCNLSRKNFDDMIIPNYQLFQKDAKVLVKRSKELFSMYPRP